MLLAPRDYLSTFMKVGVIMLLAVGILVTLPTMKNEAVTKFASSGDGPVFAGALFPFVFITIACGALSGFHSLIASGTTPKMIEKETQVRFIGYGAMLMESFVAVMAIIAACIIEPGLYYAMNAPAGVLGDTVQSASPGRQRARLPDLARASCSRRPRRSTSRRSSRAPAARRRWPSACRRSSPAPPVRGLEAFWYHFAIMFEALFILTTVDAGTRVGRFMLQDTLGNVIKPFGRVSWKPGIWITSAIVVAAWGWFLYGGVTNPLGGINQLFPLFGIANQLLAAVALTVCTTLLIKHGQAQVGLGHRRSRWPGTPSVTLTASWQKVFSDNPKLGFFAQRDKFQAALDQGDVVAPAKSLDDMHAVVTNSTVDGILAALFAVLIVIVIARRGARLGARRSARAGRCRRPRSPFEPSALVAPAGLFWTDEERALLAGVGAGDGGRFARAGEREAQRRAP